MSKRELGKIIIDLVLDEEHDFYAIEKNISRYLDDVLGLNEGIDYNIDVQIYDEDMEE